MGETGQRWAAVGVILVLLGGAFAYGKTQGELDLLVPWAEQADQKLIDHEARIATNAKGIESLRAIMQKFFVAQMRPPEPPQKKGERPYSPWKGEPFPGP